MSGRTHVVRESSDVAPGGEAAGGGGGERNGGAFFGHDFRIVKPFTFVPRGLSRDGTNSGTAVPGDVLSDSESQLPGDSGPLGVADADDSHDGYDHSSNVYRSLYTGDAYFDGSHSAELSMMDDPQRGMRPLFRWLHVPQDIQDFDELSVSPVDFFFCVFKTRSCPSHINCSIRHESCTSHTCLRRKKLQSPTR